MKFGTIASGSSGNCLYAGTRTTHLLIDAGISCKRICEGLSTYDVSGSDIAGILITHEHSDHISGLGVLARKLKVPIYATQATLEAIMGSKYMGKIDESLLRPVKPGEAFYVGDIKVNAFSIPHDAADPVSYTLESESTKLGMVTDLGYFDHYIVDQLRSSDVLYVEANHDVNMLQVGPYPYYLKQRILGSHGHLCNEMSGKLVRELLNDRLTHVVLGHLSKENNFPELALKTVQMECDGAKPVFMVAPRSCAGPLINMG